MTRRHGHPAPGTGTAQSRALKAQQGTPHEAPGRTHRGAPPHRPLLVTTRPSSRALPARRGRPHTPGPALTQPALRGSPPGVAGVGVILGAALGARGGQRPGAAEGQLAGQEASLGDERGHGGGRQAGNWPRCSGPPEGASGPQWSPLPAPLGSPDTCPGPATCTPRSSSRAETQRKAVADKPVADPRLQRDLVASLFLLR